MPPTTNNPKAPLSADHLAWLKKVSPLLGVALPANTPNAGAAPTSSESAVPKSNDTAPAAIRTPSNTLRVVKGEGGYVFEQHADGKIFILQSPKTGTDRIQVTDKKAHQAILAEIGPFPKSSSAPAAKTQSPPPSKTPAPTPTPTPNTQAGFGKGAQDMLNQFAAALDKTTGHIFTQSSDKSKAAAEPLSAQRVVERESYRDQRDNPELGDTSCNVTTLAMQLLSLARGDEAKLRQTAVDLLKKRGVTASTSTQLEELLRQLAIKVAGGETVPLSGGKTSPAWQMAFILDKVSELFTDYVANTETIMFVASKEKILEKLAPALDKGAAVMICTKLTGAGHIVKLNEVLADGILIDDPFGCRVEDGYLKNGGTIGAKHVTRINNNAALLDSRLKRNPALRKTFTDLAAAKAGTIPGNAGNDLFYSWEEVTTYNIGKWANVTYKK